MFHANNAEYIIAYPRCCFMLEHRSQYIAIQALGIVWVYYLAIQALGIVWVYYSTIQPLGIVSVYYIAIKPLCKYESII